MSRISIERRMERLRDAILPPGSYEWRLERLPDHLKKMHQIWSEKVDAINSEYKKQEINRYQRLLAGCDDTPPMPIAVHQALWPHGAGSDTITSNMSHAEAAEVYSAFLERGSTQ